MTELLYQRDSYLKEFGATVVKVLSDGVILDRTAFMPRSGGLEGDTGVLIAGERKYRVIGARFVEDGVLHILETTEGIKHGMRVHGVIDWERRYRQMRLHTAAHILSALFYKKAGALITGGHITPEKAYDDYSLESIDRALIDDVFREANEIVRRGIEVRVYWLPREEALKIPEIVKLASKMPPDIEEWRIVEIPGVDIQADGGVHVKNTREVGKIVFLEAKNKGKRRKRVYFTVQP